MNEDHTEDTGVEETQDISEQEEQESTEVEQETQEDTASEDTAGIDTFLDNIDPEAVKSGDFDEEEFSRQADEHFSGDGDDQETGEEAGDRSQPEGPPMRKIVYRGQEVEIPEDRLEEYLQKGYDYDQKVGPHQRLAQLMDMHPELQQEMIQRITAGETGGAPAAEEGDETDPYIAEQVNRIVEERMGRIMPTIQATKIQQINDALTREVGGVENHQTIHNGVLQYLGFMPETPQTKAYMQAVNNPETGEYVKLYAKVREGMTKSGGLKTTGAGQARPANRAAGNQPPAKRRESSFRVSSGSKGGDQSQPKKKGYMDLSQSEFDELVAKTKGM